MTGEIMLDEARAPSGSRRGVAQKLKVAVIKAKRGSAASRAVCGAPEALLGKITAEELSNAFWMFSCSVTLTFGPKRMPYEAIRSTYSASGIPKTLI